MTDGNPAKFPASCERRRGLLVVRHRPGSTRSGCTVGHTRQQDLTKGTTYVNTNPGGGAGPRLSVLLLVTVAAVAAAQSEAWAGAVGTAVALYSVLTIGSQDRRN